MKNRGMLLTICLIIVAGIMITLYTSQATNHSADMAAGAQRAEQENGTAAAFQEDLPETAAAAPSVASLEVRQKEVGKEPGEEPRENIQRPEVGDGGFVTEETAVAQSIISPLSGSMESITPEGEKLADKDSAIDYQARLSEIDSQIKKMRTEDTDSNTYSVKKTADHEFRLWDSVLNEMYVLVMGQIGEEEKEELKKEEREWMRTRDAAAKEAANKYNGGVLEGVEYTASMAASTRERAYELVEEYGALLGAQ